MHRLNVVLYRPVYSRNIGMCARAIANMGAGRLILVEPEGALDERARQGAAHAQEILREATIYPSLAAFETAEGEGLRIALSGRAGVRESKNLDEVVASFAQEVEHPFADQTVPIYLQFGTEANGLSDEEMALSHHICRLPTFGEITSLNLSHAVLLALYILRNGLPKEVPVAAPIVGAPIYFPGESIHQWLLELGFDLSARKVTMEKTLNRILLSQCPTQPELKTLDSVIQQTIRRLREIKTRQ